MATPVKAKRARAPARKKSAVKSAPRSKPKSRRTGKVPAHRTYSPALLANGRHRYENTPEPIAAIAADFRIHPGSLRRLAYRSGWTRYNMGPRELPAAARLLSETQTLEVASENVPEMSQPFAGFDVTVIARLERQVMEELATVEAMRAELKSLPRRPRDAETTARTLTALTDTLQKLQRLRCAVPTAGKDHDELPADLDEFRDQLARRIEAFMESRPDAEFAGDASAEPAGEPR